MAILVATMLTKLEEFRGKNLPFWWNTLILEESQIYKPVLMESFQFTNCSHVLSFGNILSVNKGLIIEMVLLLNELCVTTKQEAAEHSMT